MFFFLQLAALALSCEGFALNAHRLLSRNKLRMSQQYEPVVVTGLGVISSIGKTQQIFFDNLLNGVCGIEKVDRFDPTPFKCQIAGQVKDFDPRDYYKLKKRIKQNDLSCHYAVAASHLALEDAKLTIDSSKGIDENRVGVMIGSAFGGMETFEKCANDLAKLGPSSINPFAIPMILGNTPAGVVAMEINAKGPNFGVQTACATGSHAIGEALRSIRNGDADVIICGGCEAPITPLSFAGFCNLLAMNSQNNDAPQKASRPFDATRSGFVMSEGAGVIVLERLSHALKRGAKVYCELAGYGASCDAFHITSPDPEGGGLTRAIFAALKDSRFSNKNIPLDPSQVDYVNAHGTSTKLNDKFETIAYKKVFGDHAISHKLLISSIKGSTGHSLGAAGGLEAIACVKAIDGAEVPPTINYCQPDPDCDLNYTPNKSIKADLNVVISDNLGFGGHNGVLVFKKIK